MINVDFVNIDNAKLIGRLLPFWARGKNISLLLQSVLSPIISVHNNFKLWALEQYIYTHITSQSMSIEWYLKYKLKSHFVNSSNSFIVRDEPIKFTADGEIDGIEDIFTCFGGESWINEFDWKNNVLWTLTQASAVSIHNSEEAEPDTETENGPYIYVYAPEIVSTINYNQDDYIRDINYIVSQFMTNFNEIKIVIIKKQ